MKGLFKELGTIVIIISIMIIGKKIFDCIPNDWQYCFAYIYGGIAIFFEVWLNGQIIVEKENKNE